MSIVKPIGQIRADGLYNRGMQWREFATKNGSWAAVTAVFLFFLCLYGWTAVQGISTADNAEFQLVSQQLGLAHPPGFPLYTLLSHAFTRLPLPVAPAVRANLFPAVTSALTLVFIYLIVLRQTQSRLASVAAALMLGGATTFWAQATVANVRSMTALFAAIAFWGLAIVGDDRNRERDREKKIGIIIFVLAISFGVTHHLSLLFMGILMAIWLFILHPSSFIYFFLAPLGALPLLYLPLRSADLRTWSAFVEYALGLGFESDFFYYVTADTLWARLGVMVNVLHFQFGWPLLILSVLGLGMMLFAKPKYALLLIGSLVVHTLITATYRAPQTVEYMLPAYVPLAIGLGWLAGTKKTRHALAVIGIALGVWQLIGQWQSFDYLKTAALSDSYVLPILADAPADAPLLTNWHWYQAFVYQQTINGIRPDIDIRYDPAPWEVRIAAVGDNPAVVTDGTPGNFLHEASIINGTADTDLPPFDLTMGDITITHLDVSAATLSLDETLSITIRWTGNDTPFSWFAHLGNGIPAAQDAIDVQPGINTVTLQLMPGVGTPIGDQAIWIGTSAVPRTQIATVAIRPSAFKPFTRNRTRINDGTRTLIGYDFDNTLAPRAYLHWHTADGYYSEAINVTGDTIQAGGETISLQPETAYVPLGHGIVWLGGETAALSPGKQVRLAQQFVANRPITRDLAVSVQVTGQAPYWKAQDDGIPAMGGIPTLKWIAGSRVRDPRWVTVPDEAVAGQTAVGKLLLYDAFTGRPIPILDARINELGQGIPLLTTTIVP